MAGGRLSLVRSGHRGDRHDDLCEWESVIEDDRYWRRQREDQEAKNDGMATEDVRDGRDQRANAIGVCKGANAGQNTADMVSKAAPLSWALYVYVVIIEV